jgi:hypothetical protein
MVLHRPLVFRVRADIMGMGPILLFDKSTFEMLSREEHYVRERYFYENLTPILVTEILGDLSKAFKDGRDPRDKVADLAGKFFGSGGPVNHDAHELAVQSLIGNDPPQTGQILAQGGRRAGEGVIIDPTWWNRALLRWGQGEFSDLEKQYAELWRTVTHRPGFQSLFESIHKRGVILPKVTSEPELPKALDDLTSDPRLQDVWLDVLLERLGAKPHEADFIRRRWNAAFRSIRVFAPYAYHCLKAWVGLVMVVRHRLFKWAPTHVVDLQYLYYLPFCQVFSSNDKLHRLSTPTWSHAIRPGAFPTRRTKLSRCA